MNKEIKAEIQDEVGSILAAVTKQMMGKLYKTHKGLKFKVKPEQMFIYLFFQPKFYGNEPDFLRRE